MPFCLSPLFPLGPRPKKPGSAYLQHMSSHGTLAYVSTSARRMNWHGACRLQTPEHPSCSGLCSSTRYSSFLPPAIPEEHCQLRLHPERRSARHPPPLVLLPCIPSPLIWSPVSGCHMGTSFLSVSVSAQLSTHDTHSKDAPWSSEHKENNKGLRASSDGNVILQAFYRRLNCPRVCLYMHTEAHARPHTHTTNSMLWLKGKTTLSHHYLCLNYSLDATLCHYMDAITEH